jgi:predicted metal-dependent hydrolase
MDQETFGRLAEGVDLFNRGLYWEAHEAWEGAWMPDRRGADGGFYKGLIQVAAGCLHYRRQNRRGTLNKWRSGAEYLRPYLPRHLGVELAPLVELVDKYRVALEADGGWPELEMPMIQLTRRAGTSGRRRTR